MMWNTNDWTAEEEDKHWEMTEDDTDDEFDDIALERLGVDVPEFAREGRSETARPRVTVNDVTTPGDIRTLMDTWTQRITESGVNSEIQQQILDGLTSIQTADGTFHFGDEPEDRDPDDDDDEDY